jgi:hypothetical protein
MNFRRSNADGCEPGCEYSRVEDIGQERLGYATLASRPGKFGMDLWEGRIPSAAEAAIILRSLRRGEAAPF